MRIYDSLEDIPVFSYPVVAIGNFDGVHAGHQHLIAEVITSTCANLGTSILITFRPNTKVFFGNIEERDLVYTEEQKLEALKNLGVDVCIVLDFTSIKDMTAEEFVQKVLVEKIGMKEFIAGYDTNFGSDRKGDKNHLIALGDIYNFTVTEVEPLKKDGEIVSSTELRKR